MDGKKKALMCCKYIPPLLIFKALYFGQDRHVVYYFNTFS